ncbi:MAG: hypothetical protein U0599_00720 [Vicinamibacteria bacterium]
MDTIVPVLVGGLAVGLAVVGTALRLYAWIRNPSEHREAWRAGARRVDLARREEAGDTVAGWVGDLRVQMSPYGRSSEAPGTNLTICGPGLAASRFSFRAESLDTSVLRRAGRADVETGDDAFDRLVWITGPESLVLAVLDSPTRAAVSALVRRQLARPGRSSFYASGSFDDGTLRLDLPEELPPSETTNWLGERRRVEEEDSYLYMGGLPEHLEDAVEAAVEFARRLVAPKDVAARLLENLRTEPMAGVRLRILQCLLKSSPRAEAASAAVELGLEDPDAGVRVEAAVAAGARGRPILLGVARGEGAPDATSARAVAILADSLSVSDASEVLRHALRLRRRAAARACVRVLGARGDRDALAMLTRVLVVERGEEGDWAAEALGATGDPRGEAALLHELDAREETRRLAAARALGEAASVSAVPALRRLEEKDARLRRAAREAIARIQARQAGAEPGQLSLAEDATGRLSLSNVEAGRLSLPPDHGGTR